MLVPLDTEKNRDVHIFNNRGNQLLHSTGGKAPKRFFSADVVVAHYNDCRWNIYVPGTVGHLTIFEIVTKEIRYSSIVRMARKFAPNKEYIIVVLKF